MRHEISMVTHSTIMLPSTTCSLGDNNHVVRSKTLYPCYLKGCLLIPLLCYYHNLLLLDNSSTLRIIILDKDALRGYTTVWRRFA
jgi:hypothetical protein